MFTFRDTGKEIKLQGDLLKMITDKNYNVDLAKLSDKKLKKNFAKKMQFDVKAKGNKFKRDRMPTKLLKVPGLVVSASGF